MSLTARAHFRWQPNLLFHDPKARIVVSEVARAHFDATVLNVRAHARGVRAFVSNQIGGLGVQVFVRDGVGMIDPPREYEELMKLYRFYSSGTALLSAVREGRYADVRRILNDKDIPQECEVQTGLPVVKLVNFQVGRVALEGGGARRRTHARGCACVTCAWVGAELRRQHGTAPERVPLGVALANTAAPRRGPVHQQQEVPEGARDAGGYGGGC